MNDPLADLLDELGYPASEVKEPYVHNSKALIANNLATGGCFLEIRGVLYDEVHETGCHRLDDYGLDDAPEGLSVWEGDVWYEGEDDRAEAVLKGEFRRLNDEEWAAVREWRYANSIWEEKT